MKWIVAYRCGTLKYTGYIFQRVQQKMFAFVRIWTFIKAQSLFFSAFVSESRVSCVKLTLLRSRQVSPHPKSSQWMWLPLKGETRPCFSHSPRKCSQRLTESLLWLWTPPIHHWIEMSLYHKGSSWAFSMTSAQLSIGSISSSVVLQRCSLKQEMRWCDAGDNTPFVLGAVLSPLWPQRTGVSDWLWAPLSHRPMWAKRPGFGEMSRNLLTHPSVPRQSLFPWERALQVLNKLWIHEIV